MKNFRSTIWGLAIILILAVAVAFATTIRDDMIYEGHHAVLGNVFVVDGTTITGGAKTLTREDCGMTIVDKDATPATTWTLPANAEAGCWFMFINGIDQSANDTVTAATADTIDGIIDVNDTLTACLAADKMNTVATADVVGDWFKLISDGTHWHVRGDTLGAAAITCTG